MRHLRTAVALGALGLLLAANPLYADLFDPLGGGYGWFVHVGAVLVVLAALLGGLDYYRSGEVTVEHALAVALATVPVVAVAMVAAGDWNATTFLQRLVLYASVAAALPLGIAWSRRDRHGLGVSLALVGGAWLAYVGSAYADGPDMGDFLAFVNVLGALVFVVVVFLVVQLGAFATSGETAAADGD